MSDTSLKSEQLRSLVAEYLNGRLSVDQFDSKFVDLTWDLPPTGAPESSLRGAIYLSLGEFGLGHATEEALRHELRGLMRDLTVRPSPSLPANGQTGTSSRTQIIAFAH